jgi:hypothetical protein
VAAANPLRDAGGAVPAAIAPPARRIHEVAAEARERLERGRRHVQPTVIRKPGDEE